MTWSFETDSAFQAELDWIDEFTREEIEPLDLVFREPGDPWDPNSPAAAAMAPLRAIVKERKLWAGHLGPELGGEGYGQVKLGLMNEILGRSRFGPSVFGCQAPDSGNAEILAHFGNAAQKERFLQPLLDGKIASCYSMTEPQAGADPAEFTCTATRDGDEWVINGEKWFASHARFSAWSWHPQLLRLKVQASSTYRHRRRKACHPLYGGVGQQKHGYRAQISPTGLYPVLFQSDWSRGIRRIFPGKSSGLQCA